MQQQYIRIADRSFHVPARTSLRQDLATQGQLQRAGLAVVAMRDGETVDGRLARLVAECMRSPTALRLLAHVILPEEALRWTPAVADEAATYFRAASAEPGGSDELQQAVVAMLEGLLQAGHLQVMQRGEPLDDYLRAPDTLQRHTS